MGIKFDKYYQKLWDTCHDFEILQAAGHITENPQVNIECKIPNLTENDTILILTGCFAPIHEGHIESLVLARKELEKLGQTVKLGLLGLCHDSYVKTKTNQYPLSTRINKINEITKNVDWIKPYTWEAYQNGAMNFTSVIDSIKKQTKAKVVFLYGTDNFNFRLAFLDGELNVCTERDCSEKFERYLPNIKTNTIYIKNNLNKKLSSSIMRKNNT